jgi:hypothetical protein
MAKFRDFKFDYSEVSAVAVDTSNGQFLWIAFKQKSGACLLRKVSAHDLSQVYFSMSLPVTSINAMIVLGSVIYLAVTDTTYAVYAYYTSSPLSGLIVFTKAEMNLNESPITMTSDASNVYFLTQGISDPAQIASIDSGSSYVSTIDLTESGLEVKNAVSLTADDSGDFWVITSDEPIGLYRVFFSSGSWTLQETFLP